MVLLASISAARCSSSPELLTSTVLRGDNRDVLLIVRWARAIRAFAAFFVGDSTNTETVKVRFHFTHEKVLYEGLIFC